MTSGEVLALDEHALIAACDFYVEDIERGKDVVGGYRRDRILNVDHSRSASASPRLEG